MKDGAEKTFWANVGTLTEFEKQDGTVSRIIEIPAIGLKASVFEQTERKEYAPKPAPVATSPKSPAQMEEPTVEYPKDDINPEDIPF